LKPLHCRCTKISICVCKYFGHVSRVLLYWYEVWNDEICSYGYIKEGIKSAKDLKNQAQCKRDGEFTSVHDGPSFDRKRQPKLSFPQKIKQTKNLWIKRSDIL